MNTARSIIVMNDSQTGILRA